MTENAESTQPNKPVSRTGGGRRFIFNALGLIALLTVAILGGYASGIGVRRTNQSSIIMQQLGDQYQNALIDIEFGRYENAKQRLEWIIQNDPSFPGAQEKLTEVLVLSNQPVPTITPSLTPTPDFSGAQEAFARAQQLIAAQDWPGAIGALDQMRKLDPNYEQSKVDGMYYFALRNYGYSLIVQQGNLEGGIYQLTLAERFGPLDRDSNGLRVGARQYLIGASFWELDWAQALQYFSDVAGYNLWDGTMYVSERIHIASMRRGDELFDLGQYCDAVTMYQNAQAIGNLDNVAAANFEEAFGACFPVAEPTATLDPALLTPSVTPGTPAETEPPKTEEPTQTPTEETPPTTAPSS